MLGLFCVILIHIGPYVNVHFLLACVELAKATNVNHGGFQQGRDARRQAYTISTRRFVRLHYRRNFLPLLMKMPFAFGLVITRPSRVYDLEGVLSKVHDSISVVSLSHIMIRTLLGLGITCPSRSVMLRYQRKGLRDAVASSANIIAPPPIE